MNGTLPRTLQLALTIPSDVASGFIPNNTDAATDDTSENPPESGGGEQTVVENPPESGGGEQPVVEDAGAGNTAEGDQVEPTPPDNSPVMTDAEYIVCAP